MTLIGEVLLFCRDAIGVFCGPDNLYHLSLLKVKTVLFQTILFNIISQLFVYTELDKNSSNPNNSV